MGTRWVRKNHSNCYLPITSTSMNCTVEHPVRSQLPPQTTGVRFPLQHRTRYN
ncbi:hypothetical protein BD777DRAFT_9536 [Yarrowia lipolytica]|nr:hypothetical protein BD777DRAFT_9536 [Yarrowia lipolytica]